MKNEQHSKVNIGSSLQNVSLLVATRSGCSLLLPKAKETVVLQSLQFMCSPFCLALSIGMLH